MRPRRATQIREYRGTLTEPGSNSPFRDRSRRREPRPVRAHARRRVPRRRARLARQDRHGVAEHEDARPAAVPDPARAPLPHRQRLVHLPALRLRALPVRLARGHHALDLHAGVREPPRRSTTGSSRLPRFRASRSRYEFARLNLTYTVMSKRSCSQLVQGKHVNGWDDPRMPTIAGLRRRGYTPRRSATSASAVGVAKLDSIVDSRARALRPRGSQRSAPRVMAVLRPLEVVIDELSRGPGRGARRAELARTTSRARARAPVPFSRELYIERDDFLRGAAEEVLSAWRRAARCACATRTSSRATRSCKDADRRGRRSCAAPTIPTTRGGDADGRKVKGTIHWVSASTRFQAEVRLYDRLFNVEAPGSDERDFIRDMNPDSFVSLPGEFRSRA